eukprot:CAMPEP_0198701224 /NCGR_PEP_ID=MMETSP1468-20131203/381815_1 /TAXON_ID=1461545 /ORGANISM="Mantoniella sp, Strain CCMP1436" /LENGTH=120 /DNA_ID=CAMNT_0044459465 /DNA_START=105 /DNA_END=464 /DNA_ORIENTATION=-
MSGLQHTSSGQNTHELQAPCPPSPPRSLCLLRSSACDMQRAQHSAASAVRCDIPHATAGPSRSSEASAWHRGSTPRSITASFTAWPSDASSSDPSCCCCTSTANAKAAAAAVASDCLPIV